MSLINKGTISQDVQESVELLEETIEREDAKESMGFKEIGCVTVIYGISIAVFVYIVVKILTL